MEAKNGSGVLARLTGALRRGRWKIGSIQSVIIVSFTAVAVLSMILLSTVLYSVFSTGAEHNAATSSQQLLEQVSLNLESYVNGMSQISDLICSSLGQTHNGNLENLLQTTASIRTDIVSMAVYDGQGNVLEAYPSGGYDGTFAAAQQDWFQQAVSQPAGYIYLPPHVDRLYAGKRPWVVSLCRGVQAQDDSSNGNNVVIVNMNFSAIEQLCKKVSLGTRGYIYILDDSGDIIYHPQQQLIYLGLKEENIPGTLGRSPGSYVEEFQGERRILTIKDMGYTHWKIAGISYVDELVSNRAYLGNLILAIALVVLVFEVLAALFISNRITRPIKQLERQMKRVESGDFDIRVEERGEDEVKRLSRTFNLMIVRIRQLMEQNIQEQQEIRKSELKALQAQINPHFLYNTLDSIVWMNENQRYEGVTIMVNALAKFFRISISKGNDIISVADELEHARSYMTIQQIRYKNKFSYHIEADPAVLAHKTLKLILQPILENAIYHGVANLQEPGIIRVRALLEQGDILFQVIDNGYGIKPEALRDILKREPRNEQSSVGLKNVNERIKLYYGEDYGLNIESELDVGTTVSIRVPANQ